MTSAIHLVSVRSFSTPGVVYRLTRSGERKDSGGSGVHWSCDCPDYQNRAKGPGYVCKHMRGLFVSLRGGRYLDGSGTMVSLDWFIPTVDGAAFFATHPSATVRAWASKKRVPLRIPAKSATRPKASGEGDPFRF